MKKILVLFCVVAMLLTGCSFGKIKMSSSKDDKEYADTVEKLLGYIDSGDEAQITSMLCNGLKESDYISGRVSQLVNGFEGDIVSVTEYEHNTVSGETTGNKRRVTMEQTFYVTTDKQVYQVYIGYISVNEVDADGEDVVGINSIAICTLDYASGDISSDNQYIEVANTNCGVNSNYGDSSNYLIVDSGENYEVLNIYRISNPESSVNYEDIINWSDRSFDDFKDSFGEPYAEKAKQLVSGSYYCYLYRIKDNSKYLYITVDEQTNNINIINIDDIDGHGDSESIMKML